MLVLADSWPQRLLLSVDGDLHVGRVELGLDVVPLAVVDQDVASQLDDAVTLQMKWKRNSFQCSLFLGITTLLSQTKLTLLLKNKCNCTAIYKENTMFTNK